MERPGRNKRIRLGRMRTERKKDESKVLNRQADGHKEKNRNQESFPCTKWLLAFFVTLVSCMAAVIGLVVFVDPFFQYHAPLKDFPYLIDNQLSQNPGMARNMDYDSVLLGSSMTVNFEADWFLESGLHLLKLPYNGAYPKDISNIMKQADYSGNELKEVFLGIDIASYTVGTEETKYPVPEYLYDRNPLNDIAYWFNKEVLLDYIFKPPFSGDGATDLSSVYNSQWWMVNFYGKEQVLSNYTPPEKTEFTGKASDYTDRLLENLEENIRPVITSHPDTRFTIFFPPPSVLFWYDYVQSGQLEVIMEEFRVCCEWLFQFENVRVFYFANMEEVITDLDLYADVSHHNQEINRYMTECFVSGEHEVTGENLEEELAAFRRIIEEYDYEGLFEE